MRVPRKLIEPYFDNLLQYTDIEAGHFTTFEVPKQVTDDIKSFIAKVLEQEKIKFAEEQARKVQESTSNKIEI